MKYTVKMCFSGSRKGLFTSIFKVFTVAVYHIRIVIYLCPRKTDCSSSQRCRPYICLRIWAWWGGGTPLYHAQRMESTQNALFYCGVKHVLLEYIYVSIGFVRRKVLVDQMKARVDRLIMFVVGFRIGRASITMCANIYTPLYMGSPLVDWAGLEKCMCGCFCVREDS